VFDNTLEDDMVLYLRSDQVHIDIEIRQIDDRFAEKLAMAWIILQDHSGYQPGRIVVAADLEWEKLQNYEVNQSSGRIVNPDVKNKIVGVWLPSSGGI
jgi:hypothetical protein